MLILELIEEAIEMLRVENAALKECKYENVQNMLSKKDEILSRIKSEDMLIDAKIASGYVINLQDKAKIKNSISNMIGLIKENDVMLSLLQDSVIKTVSCIKKSAQLSGNNTYDAQGKARQGLQNNGKNIDRCI